MENCRQQGHSRRASLALFKPLTCAFSMMNGGPSLLVTVTFLNWMPLAFLTDRPVVAAVMLTFSRTTSEIGLSGNPMMIPADLRQVAVRLLIRMSRKIGVVSLAL